MGAKQGRTRIKFHKHKLVVLAASHLDGMSVFREVDVLRYGPNTNLAQELEKLKEGPGEGGITADLAVSTPIG